MADNINKVNTHTDSNINKDAAKRGYTELIII